MFYRSSQDRPHTRVPFKVYADAQHSTPLVASVSRPKYARLQTSTPGMVGCTVLRELGANNGFKLSPNSQVRAEKENFDPVKKQFVCYKGASSSNGNAADTPLKENGRQGSCGRILGSKMPSRAPMDGNRNKSHANNSRSALAAYSGNAEPVTPTNTRMNLPRCPALVHSNGQGGNKPNVAVPRGSGIKRLSLLLDDMTLSEKQEPVGSTNTGRPQNRGGQDSLQRLSLPPPAFVPSGGSMMSPPPAVAGATRRNRATSLQDVAMNRGYNANSTERAYKPSYATRHVGKDHSALVNGPQVPRSNNGNGNRARKIQLSVNMLTPPNLRQSIR